MERGTFTSEAIKEFNGLSGLIREKYGVIVHLAEIRGSRWSYAAGKNTGEIPVSSPERVKLNERSGVIIYRRQKPFPGEKEKISGLLENFKKNING